MQPLPQLGVNLDWNPKRLGPPPKVITEESAREYLKQGLEALEYNSRLIDGHEVAFNEACKIIVSQTETIEGLVEENHTLRLRLARREDCGSLSDVISRCYEAVMSIFFFLMNVLLTAAEAGVSLLQYTATVIHPRRDEVAAVT